MISLDVIYCNLYNQPEGEWYTWGLGVEREGKDIKVQPDRKDGRQAGKEVGQKRKKIRVPSEKCIHKKIGGLGGGRVRNNSAAI